VWRLFRRLRWQHCAWLSRLQPPPFPPPRRGHCSRRRPAANTAGPAPDIAAKQDVQALEQRMLLRFAEVEARIDHVVVRLGSLIVVLTGMLFAALHYLAAPWLTGDLPSGPGAK
jgi:hypothetical protein